MSENKLKMQKNPQYICILTTKFMEVGFGESQLWFRSASSSGSRLFGCNRSSLIIP